MKMLDPDLRAVFLFAWFSAFVSVPALAKSNASMDVKPGVYKAKSGSDLPNKGPIVRVYAEGSSTQYSHVANTHKTLPVLVKYTATCSNKGDLSGGNITVGGAETGIDTGDGFSSESVWVNVPYNKVAKVKPAQQCNEHAKTLSLQENKKLDKIVQKGFTMRIPNVLSAKGTAFCTAAGLGKGDVDSDTTNGLGIYLRCEANPKARSPKKTTGTRRAGNTNPGKTRTSFKSASMSIESPNHIGKCPVSMKANGAIHAKDKGEIEYQIIGDGNYTSPLKKMKFTKAGKKKFSWTRMVRKKESNATLALPNGQTDQNKISGWLQLKVIYKIKNNIAYSKKNWFSERQDFHVTCGTQPARLKKR